MMKIVIMRHGEAHSRAETDFQRELTPKGIADTKLAGEVLAQQGFQPDELWVSPYVRTQQTANQLQLSLPECPRLTQSLLEPENDPRAVAELLEKNRDQNLLIVSHQPLVSALVGLLAEANTRLGPPMSPASMVMLEAQLPLAGCCDLRWVKHAPLFEST